MAEHSPEQIRLEMRPDQRMDDIGADLQTIEEYQANLSRDGAMPPDGPEKLRNFLLPSVAKVRTLDVSRLYTNEFLPRSD